MGRIVAFFACVFVWQAVTVPAHGRADDNVLSPGLSPDKQQHKPAHEAHQSPQCQALAESFVKKGLGSASIVPSTKNHDPDMDICYRGNWHPHHKTCCSRNMEKQFHASAVNNFMSSVQTTSSFLVDLLENNSQHYQGMFVKMIQAAQNSTESLFDEIYKIPVRQRHGPISNLFMKLQAHVRLDTVVLDESMEQFWDDIFPLVFQHTISDLGDVRLSEDYKLCLSQLREELPHPPFGEPAQQLTRSIIKSLTTVKYFLRSLHMLLDTLNTTSRIHPEHQCAKTMARMTYCSMCAGELDVLPCKGYCQNVVRGCLASVSDLNKPWNNVIDQLVSLTTNMRGIYNIETVMSTVHHRVSEAIMHSMEVGPKIYPKILAKCGKPADETTDDKKAAKKKGTSAEPRTKAKQPDSSTLKTFWDEHDPELHSKIENFMRSLKGSQGFYGSLPDAVCTKPEFSAGVTSQCWNGETVSSYEKSVPENLITDQRLDNPEVKVPTALSPQLEQIKTDLLDLSQELSDRAMKELEVQADDPAQGYTSYRKRKGKNNKKDERYGGYRDNYDRYQYSGDGGASYPPDDEAYTADDDWSGSGSGYGSDEGEGHPHYRTGVNKKPNSPTEEGFEFGDKEDKSPYIPVDKSKQQTPEQDIGGSATLTPHAVGLAGLLTLLQLIMLRIRGFY